MTITATGTASWNPEALEEILSNDAGRPVLFTNAGSVFAAARACASSSRSLRTLAQARQRR
ncbi:hypothetical protein [Streptomyces sp. NPDC002769]|uniref:hypothetical protein n=1 Tax=Streptomyces sp. NPDC002769 TaxID=3154542 RepID=UPI003328637D